LTKKELSTTPIPERHRKVGHLSRRLAQVYLGLMLQVLDRYGLDPTFYSVLVELSDHPKLDQRTLGASLGIDRTSIGQICDALEERGLISRAISQTDRRARELQLTKEGDRLRLTIRPKILAAQEQLLAPLTAKERIAFNDMLYRVVTANLDVEVSGGWRHRKRG
jgi:MarR family transcriptional regulator, temperature-dependent positive regulator of motility